MGSESPDDDYFGHAQALVKIAQRMGEADYPPYVGIHVGGTNRCVSLQYTDKTDIKLHKKQMAHPAKANLEKVFMAEVRTHFQYS